MRLAGLLLLIVSIALVAWVFLDLRGLTLWAADQQRGFQNEMASAVMALRSGDLSAYIALLAAAGAYGFVHAVGPGHGKYLVGSVGIGSSVPLGRLVAVAVCSSLAQAIWAIVLVYGAFLFLEGAGRQVSTLAEDYLAPASYVAIASIGCLLAWRGVRTLTFGRRHRGDARSTCGCSAHGLSSSDVAALGSPRAALALIGSIAIRPCTGAIFLLVIAWQMDLKAAGAAAVLVMGLGTAALTSGVAASSIVARGATFTSAGLLGTPAHAAVPSLQILAGGSIVWFSMMLLGLTL
ncbi:MAG: hypothetical protein AAF913_18075 [Pseudomonadota bacterium]